MEAIAIIKYAVENYKEIGGGATAFILALFFAYNKYINKQIASIYDKIKHEQQHDREQFRKIKSELKRALSDMHNIEVQVAYKRTKLDKFEQELNKMILGLEAQEKQIIDNAHKLELTERTIDTMKNILEDIIGDVKEFQSRSNNMEMSLAKLLGALSRNFD